MLPQRANGSLGTGNRLLAQRYSGGVVVAAFFLGSLAAAYVLTTRVPADMFPYILAALFFASIYTVLSFRNLVFPFIIVVLSVGGFRFIWSIQAPVLPDLYLDRMMIIWLMVVFAVKFFAEGRRPRGPYALDMLLLLHGGYLLYRIGTFGMAQFHPWSMSIMVPYLVYFFAKNIVYEIRHIRMLLAALLILGVYYSITSIGEKFDIAWLLYPKSMILEHEEFVGRSCGPFRNSGIFGNTVGMLLPLNLYFLATTRRRWLKIFLLGNLALGFIGLYFSYTRGAWMTGIVCLATVAFLNRRDYLRTLLPMAVLVPFAATLVLGLGQDTFMKERVENDDTIGARVGTAVTALRVWRDNPFLGCGSFRYHEVREKYIEPVDVPGMPKIRFVQFRKNAVHDMYLGPLAEDGLLGTVLQFGIYFLIARIYLGHYRRRSGGDHFKRYIIPLFAGIFLAYLAGGMTQSFRHVSIMGTLMYMGAGIASGYRPEEDRTRDEFA